MLRNQKGETYEAWADEVKQDTDKRPHWKRIGDWIYPTRSNQTFELAFWHVCPTNFVLMDTYDTRAVELHEDYCQCHEPVPEGIKMVALLTERV